MKLFGNIAKAVGQCGDGARERHGNLGGLAEIAQIERRRHLPACFGDALGGEIICCLLFKRGKRRLNLAGRNLGERPDHRLDVVVIEIGGGDAAGGKQAGMARHDNLAEAQFARHGGGMQRPAAAERDQRIVARIAAALDRDRADRLGDLVGGDLIDADDGRVAGDAERSGNMLRDRRFGTRALERHFAVGEGRRVEQPHQQVDVGERRLIAAPAVTGRPRLRAHAVGPDLDPADIVDAHDAAAAGADGMHVEHRDGDGKQVDFARRRRFRRRTANQADVERGAADIHGDQVAVTGLTA